jgi:mRNA interferase MazF
MNPVSVLWLRVAKRVRNNALDPGDIILVTFPTQVPPGREQQGYRPAIVVGIPQRLGPPRYPLLLVVPLTSNRQQSWAMDAPTLYPKLNAGDGNLPANSIVLLDQVRSIDSTRVVRYIGTLTVEQFKPMFDSLAKMMAPSEG